ncbi:MAG: DUF4123 domain-containing protein [Pseudomonadota bacterium]
MNDAIDTVDVPAWQAHVEHLHRHFHEHAHERCLLWVNPAQADPFAADPLVQERRVQVAILHPRFDVALGPYLVPLDLSRSADADVLRSSMAIAWHAWSGAQLRACQGQPVAGWVASAAPPGQLAGHWARHCHLHRHNGLSKLLRFHDPGVREWLWPALTAQQQRILLGPAASLFSIGRAQSLLHHHAAPAQDDASLVLEAYQWAQVDDYAVVHAAWVAWNAMQPADSATLAIKGWEQGIFSALSHASRYGVMDAQDRQLFALHALQLNDDFHRSERMAAVWDKTRAGDFYSSAVENVFKRPADQFHTLSLGA